MDQHAMDRIQHFLSVTPREVGDCVMLSGSLNALLRSDGIETNAVCGSVSFQSELLFLHEEDIDLKSPATVYDGHCWVKMDDWLIDISLSRTATSMRSERYDRLKHLIADKGRWGAPIIGKETALEESFDLVYIARQELPLEFCDRVLDGLRARVLADYEQRENLTQQSPSD